MSADRARRLALGAQGFGVPRPTGRVDRRHVRKMLASVGLIQIDSVNVIVRSQELPLFSRLGPHRRDLLSGMVEDGELFEYWGHEASLLPIELFPLMRWRMEAAGAKAAGWSGLVRLAQERPDYVEAVYEEVRERGLVVRVRARRPGREVGPLVGVAARQAGARVPVLVRSALGSSTPELRADVRPHRATHPAGVVRRAGA